MRLHWCDSGIIILSNNYLGLFAVRVLLTVINKDPNYNNTLKKFMASSIEHVMIDFKKYAVIACPSINEVTLTYVDSKLYCYSMIKCMYMYGDIQMASRLINGRC